MRGGGGVKLYFDLCCKQVIELFNPCPSKLVGIKIPKCVKIDLDGKEIIFSIGEDIMFNYQSLSTDTIEINNNPETLFGYYLFKINTNNTEHVNKICINSFRLPVHADCLHLSDIGKCANASSFITLECVTECVNYDLEVNITTNIDNNMASVSVQGGELPYEYKWTNSAGDIVSTTENVISFIDDTYTVYVSDPNCTVSDSIYLTAFPCDLAVIILGNGQGQLSALVQNGTAPFEYEWTNTDNDIVSTSSSIDNLPKDTYTVQVTDANNCVATASANISCSESNLYIFVLTFIDQTGAFASTSGGNTPLTFEWRDPSNNIVSTSSTVNSTGPGVYTIVVTDAEGCTVTDTANLL